MKLIVVFLLYYCLTFLWVLFLQGGAVPGHMIHPPLLETQCVVRRVHSLLPHHMIESGSDLNPTAVVKTVVLLLVMSFTRTQVGPAHMIIISLLIEILC